MKKVLVRAAVATALLCGSVGTAVVVTTGAAMADEQKVSHDVGVALNDAIKALQAKDYATATAKVQDAEAAKKTDYDEFKIDEVKAAIAIPQKDFTTAEAAYEGMISSPAFPDLAPDDQISTLKNAVILSAASQKWAEVIAYAKKLTALNGMDQASYENLAVAYYNTQDKADAVTAAQKSIDMAKAAGQTPGENVLQIVANAQLQNNPSAATQTWEDMVQATGNVQALHNLVAVATNGQPVQTQDALYYYRLLYAAGAMKNGDDYQTLASMANEKKDFEEARVALEAGISSGKLTAAQATLLPKVRHQAEQDAGILSSAAKGAKTPDQMMDVAQDYYGFGRYADAIAEAQRALASGLKDPSNSKMLIGISQVQSGKYDDGINTLSQVQGSAIRQKAAHLWTLYAQAMKNKTGSAAAPTGNPGGN